MEEVFFLVKEDELEGGYIATAVQYPIVTEANTMDELKLMIKDALDCHFDDDNKRIVRIHYSKQEIFAI
jgi:hypothetical protein